MFCFFKPSRAFRSNAQGGTLSVWPPYFQLFCLDFGSNSYRVRTEFCLLCVFKCRGVYGTASLLLGFPAGELEREYSKEC